MALHEHYSGPFNLGDHTTTDTYPRSTSILNVLKEKFPSVEDSLKGKKITWVGDVNNILNDMLVSLPRFGMKVAVAAPKGYDVIDPEVWRRV